jgi:hypothetical protein
VWDEALGAWRAWRTESSRRRREREELEWLMKVDYRTRQDLGWLSRYTPEDDEIGEEMPLEARLRALHLLHRI